MEIWERAQIASGDDNLGIVFTARIDAKLRLNFCIDMELEDLSSRVEIERYQSDSAELLNCKCAFSLTLSFTHCQPVFAPRILVLVLVLSPLLLLSHLPPYHTQHLQQTPNLANLNKWGNCMSAMKHAQNRLPAQVHAPQTHVTSLCVVATNFLTVTRIGTWHH